MCTCDLKARVGGDITALRKYRCAVYNVPQVMCESSHRLDSDVRHAMLALYMCRAWCRTADVSSSYDI